jgi:hypothetical protein
MRSFALLLVPGSWFPHLRLAPRRGVPVPHEETLDELQHLIFQRTFGLSGPWEGAGPQLGQAGRRLRAQEKDVGREVCPEEEDQYSAQGAVGQVVVVEVGDVDGEAVLQRLEEDGGQQGGGPTSPGRSALAA